MREYLKPGLVAGMRSLSDAQRDWKAMVAYTQSECKHTRVLQAPWRSSEWFGPSTPVRLCLECGLEEQAEGICSTWPCGVYWPGEQRSTEEERRPAHKSKLNTKFVMEVTRDELFKHRIPKP